MPSGNRDLKSEARKVQELTGASYTKSLRAVSNTSDRAGLDQLWGRPVHHPQIHLLERADGLGYRNGSITPEAARLWVPVLEEMQKSAPAGYRWQLENVGPALDAIWLVSIERGSDEYIAVFDSVSDAEYARGERIIGVDEPTYVTTAPSEIAQASILMLHHAPDNPGVSVGEGAAVITVDLDLAKIQPEHRAAKLGPLARAARELSLK